MPMFGAPNSKPLTLALFIPMGTVAGSIYNHSLVLISQNPKQHSNLLKSKKESCLKIIDDNKVLHYLGWLW